MSLADAGVASLISMVWCIVIVRWIVVMVRHPMLGVGGCPRCLVVRFVNMLAVWAVTWTVWTELYQRAVTFGTLLSEPLCVVADDVTYQEGIGALGGTMCDCDGVVTVDRVVLVAMARLTVGGGVVGMVR